LQQHVLSARMPLRSGFILLTVLTIAPVSALWAQESLPAVIEPSVEPDQPERIVEGRPPFYSLKHNAHPLTWLELAFKPAFRSAESGWIYKLLERKRDTDKESGIRFGADGVGIGSGFGPRVTFFNKNLLGRGIDVEVPLTYTYKQYQLFEFNGSIPLPYRKLDKLSFDLGTAYISRAQDDFFGIGNNSPEDETKFRTVTRQASAGFTAKWNEQWTSRFGVTYRSVGVTEPTAGVSTQDTFNAASVPGLFGATLGSAGFFVTRDTEKRDNYSFKGGLDDFQISFNRSIDGSDFEYWRYHFYSQHFFWLTDDGRKVLAARGLVETNVTPAGHLMPFFDMPFVGSDDTLRGFDNFRFRDKSALALSLEYRYRIWPRLDWGVFIDEGQVAPQLGDMGLDHFHTGYGVRLFVWPKPDLPISIDYGRSNESWRLYINFNARF
jgi:outer membrane protein assembly factor BamA